MHTFAHTRTYTRIVIAEYFVGAKFWTRSQCLSVGDWLDELWHNDISESFVAAK